MLKSRCTKTVGCAKRECANINAKRKKWGKCMWLRMAGKKVKRASVWSMNCKGKKGTCKVSSKSLQDQWEDIEQRMIINIFVIQKNKHGRGKDAGLRRNQAWRNGSHERRWDADGEEFGRY